MLKQKAQLLQCQKELANAKNTLELARIAHEKYLTKFQQSDLDEAVNYYIETLKKDPSLPETYYRLACLLWEKGEIGIDTALEQCKTALEISPKNANAHIYTAYFLKLANNLEGAEKEFYEAIKLHPFHSARARLFLSMLLMEKMGKESKNIFELPKLLHYLISGTFMMCWDKPSLKMMYSSIKDDIASFRYKFLGSIFENMKKNEKAIQTYSQAAEKTGHVENFYASIGDVCLKENNPQDAVVAYRKALRENPNNRNLLVKLATVLQTYFEDNVDEAIDCYTKLLLHEPQNAKIYYELGHLYIQKEDRINAVNAFKLALDIDVENPFYHNSLAYALVQVEHYDEAIEHYKKAISINPENEWTSIVCQALGLIYYQIKENSEAALAFYDMAIVLDQKAIDAYIAIGDIHFDEDDLDAAIKSYCDAITVDPENAKAYGKAGMALWEKDYVEEAIIAYNKAIKYDPCYALAQNNLGVIYLDGIGNVREAISLFEKAVRIKPDYTLANFNLGRAYHSMKNRTLAAQYYQAAIDLNKLTNELDEEDIESRLYDLFRVN